jgi:hypothetical protein
MEIEEVAPNVTDEPSGDGRDLGLSQHAIFSGSPFDLEDLHCDAACILHIPPGHCPFAYSRSFVLPRNSHASVALTEYSKRQDCGEASQNFLLLYHRVIATFFLSEVAVFFWSLPIVFSFTVLTGMLTFSNAANNPAIET